MDIDVERFEVQGAGEIEVFKSANGRCGTAIGVHFGCSWGKYGFAGGVMDRKDVARLRDLLDDVLADRPLTIEVHHEP